MCPLYLEVRVSRPTEYEAAPRILTYHTRCEGKAELKIGSTACWCVWPLQGQYSTRCMALGGGGRRKKHIYSTDQSEA